MEKMPYGKKRALLVQPVWHTKEMTGEYPGYRMQLQLGNMGHKRVLLSSRERHNKTKNMEFDSGII